VDNLEVVVRIPENESLRFKVLNIRTAPDVFVEDGFKVYRWTFRRMKPASRDKFAGHEKDPFLYFTMTDMQRAFFRLVNQPAFHHHPGTELKEKVDTLIKQKNDEIDIILELQNMVVRKLNHKEIPLEFTGYKIRTSEQVWQSGYGNSLERAVLLADLLVSAGINAYPVAGIKNEYFSRDHGNFGLIQKYFVQVNPVKSGRIYLSTGNTDSQNNIFSIDGLTFIQLDGAIESVRTFNEKEYKNKLSLSGSITLNDSLEMSGDLEIEITNGWNPYYKLRKDSTYAIRNLHPGGISDNSVMRRITEAVSIAEVNLLDTIAFTVRDNYLFYSLPEYQAGFDMVPLAHEWDISTSYLVLPYTFMLNSLLEISMPENWQLVNEPMEYSYEADAGTVHMVLRQDKNLVTVQKYLEFNKIVFTVRETEEVRLLVETWFLGNIPTLIFSRDLEE